MIHPKELTQHITQQNIHFFTGVPDSLLKEFLAYITDTLPPENHVIAANEGAAIGLAIGHYIATSQVPLVYLQNSGIGNCINPLLSLAYPYQIPMLLLIGYRGEPGTKDEPQHIIQGDVLCPLLDAIKLPYHILPTDLENAKDCINTALSNTKKNNHPEAIIVKKDTFSPYKSQKKPSPYPMSREKAISIITNQLNKNAIYIGTTGKTSRELFELRSQTNTPHDHDFLTIGGMGHCNQIALGIAREHPNKQVVCIDGDGAILMHMGSLPLIGTSNQKNLIHIVINNGCHESVGGQQTVGFDINLNQIASGSGYKIIKNVKTEEELTTCLKTLPEKSGPYFIEVKVKPGSRSNLGRPTETPLTNKTNLMTTIQNKIKE